ncbi:hypothetical protein C1631_003095 [Chryseobacterium phosphatilyticum]|uniref:Uncharacterized protein n=1 Tax=Chryseobacterium phosphatilyticum TaxID=475075 RepID=A0A316XFW7_9FLAO|nr:hypothetical protein [Chryseobacterium phosphatilyticum]PWN71626.1 hypothetical protein C1631_003095 [Chryseobacterium phosphatilyticum]
MEIPEQIRVRLLLTFGKEIFYKFYWFEMNGDDFYWGSAYQANYSEKTTTSFTETKELELEIPKDFNELEKNSGKYSFHQSGHIHYKINLKDGTSDYKNISIWPKKEEIDKPVRFFTVLSRTLKHYNKQIGNLTKGNSSAVGLNFMEETKEKRVYFEFFLSPAGEFPIPDTLIKIEGNMDSIICHPMSDHLILIIRHGVMENLSDWHPEKELSIIENDI